MLQYCLTGRDYDFPSGHRELDTVPKLRPSEEDRHWACRTPAMAAGISDHIWTLQELLCYKA